MAADRRPMRVAVEAHLVPGEFGGVEQVIVGLAHGLSGLTDSDDEFVFMTYEGDQGWLEPHIGGNCRIVCSQKSPAPSAWKRAARSLAPALGPAWRRLRYGATAPQLGPLPSDGAVEALGIDVMHFTMQDGFLTDIPSVYHPHDLQHLHLAQFFDEAEINRREAMYLTMCDQAAMVTVASEWGKADLIEHYGLSEDKVVVIQLAPALGAHGEPSAEEVRSARQRLHLPDRYVFYPAQTWPHKNHVRLLEAIARLRDVEGMTVPLVLSGRENEYGAAIRSRIAELGLANTTLVLGFVPAEDLRVLYAQASAVVIPSLFEAAGGFPLYEAFLSGTPAACSNVTSVPDAAGDAALIFEPTDVSAIAAAVRQLWTDPVLCDLLVVRGRENVSRFTWDKTARIFRAHYRRISDRALTDEDRALIAAPPAF